MERRHSTAAHRITMAILMIALSGGARAQEAPPPADTLKDAFPAKNAPLRKAPSYSPYPGWNFPTRPLWGDTHVHTNASMDAGAFGCRLGLDEAYRFAQGEEVTSSMGIRVKLSRP